MKRRVVITGLGMISPLGIGNDATWQGLIEGRSGIDRITKFDASAFPCQIAGEVRGFEPEKWIEKKEVKKSDTFIHYAIAAAQMAIDDSGVDTTKEDSDRVGVIIGSGIGGLPLIEEMHKKLLERGPSRISPFASTPRVRIPRRRRRAQRARMRSATRHASFSTMKRM